MAKKWPNFTKWPNAFFMASAVKNGQIFRNWPWNGQSCNHDRDFVIKAETETWKFETETETRDLTFLWW